MTNIFAHKHNSNLGRSGGEDADREVLDLESREACTSLTQGAQFSQNWDLALTEKG